MLLDFLITRSDEISLRRAISLVSGRKSQAGQIAFNKAIFPKLCNDRISS